MSALPVILLAILATWSLVGIAASAYGRVRFPCDTYTEDCWGHMQRLILALGFLALALK